MIKPTDTIKTTNQSDKDFKENKVIIEHNQYNEALIINKKIRTLRRIRIGSIVLYGV